ncbi:hypothetical protein NHQ30_011088 [Ciborinia camelliae]|nr:hypothetical protein NHQ30_011088 [Ciborinia camelliae]
MTLKDLNILQTGTCTAPDARCRPCREQKIIRILQQNCGLPSEVLSQLSECNCQPFRLDSPDDFTDCIIVSIDLEVTKFQDDIKEVGICTLDTRDIKISKHQPTIDVNKVLSSYSFSLHRHKGASTRFRYGETKRMARHNVKSMIERIFRTGSPLDQSIEARQVILIANGISSDLTNLRKFGLMPDLRKFPDIILIDTAEVGRRLIKEKIRMWLWSILEFFQIPFSHNSLHQGGNDANLTLKALIMLSLESCKDLSWTPEQEKIRTLLLLVVREAAPYSQEQIDESMEKETKACRKEFRETSWDCWADNDEEDGLGFSFESE